MDDTTVENWDEHCLVCNKSVERGGGMCHVKVEARMIALCCPLCIEAFNKDPKHYLGLRTANELRIPGPRLKPDKSS